MKSGIRSLMLGACVVLLSAGHALAGSKPVGDASGKTASRSGYAPNARLAPARWVERNTGRDANGKRYFDIMLRGSRKPDVPVVISDADERDEMIKSKAQRDSMRDPIIRAIVAGRFGKEAVRIADENPRLLGMMNGDYSEKTVRLALNISRRIVSGNRMPHMAGKAFTDLADDSVITETIYRQIGDYAPVYYFHSQYDGDHDSGTTYCFPIEWKYEDRNRCRPSVPDGVPVYPSITFRPEEQGGGIYSYWINYHVFYGWQQGWIGGEHGDDWETTSVHFVNDRPVAVKYRVHGGAVTIYPWNSTPRTGNRHKVYVGTYFHGHYPTNYCRIGFNATFGEFYKTWWDCRGDGIVLQPYIVGCGGFERYSSNGDACNNFSRNLFDEPRQSTKPEPAPKSGIPTAHFDVPANLVLGPNQTCYTMGTTWQGIGDCTDSSIPWIGETMNDAISHYRWYVGDRWKSYRHFSYEGTGWIFGEDSVENDEISSIRRL